VRLLERNQCASASLTSTLAAQRLLPFMQASCNPSSRPTNAVLPHSHPLTQNCRPRRTLVPCIRSLYSVLRPSSRPSTHLPFGFLGDQSRSSAWIFAAWLLQPAQRISARVEQCPREGTAGTTPFVPVFCEIRCLVDHRGVGAQHGAKLEK
jgi:hypothetical protein